MYGEGISKMGEVLDLGVNAGIVEKSGAWFSYDGQRVGQNRENAKLSARRTPKWPRRLNARSAKTPVWWPTICSTPMAPVTKAMTTRAAAPIWISARGARPNKPVSSPLINARDGHATADVGARLVVDPPTVAGPAGRQAMAR